MKINKQRKRMHILPLLSVVTILCTACGGQGAATVMELVKTEGSVDVLDDEGTDVPVNEKMKLHSGYDLKTAVESFAWINLDSVKLAKMDADSEIEIQKNGKALEIQVNSGRMFFNITEPLDDDETMTIHTATMTVGIRGTCGWVDVVSENQMNVYLLKGKVECSIEEADGGVITEEITSGEMAEMILAEDGAGEINVDASAGFGLPEFVEGEVSGIEDTEGYDSWLGEYVCDEGGSLTFDKMGESYWIIPVESPSVDVPIPIIGIQIIDGICYDDFDELSFTLQDGKIIVKGFGDFEFYSGIYYK